MKLSDFEKAMLSGRYGKPRQRALEQQVMVGNFFDAPDFVKISQVHLMADTESLGEAGVNFLEKVSSELFCELELSDKSEHTRNFVIHFITSADPASSCDIGFMAQCRLFLKLFSREKQKI